VRAVGLRETLALVGLLLLAGAPLSAQEGLRATILQPPRNMPLFGQVQVEVAVRTAGSPVQRVEVYLDGVRAGVLTRPPWRLAIEVGDDNVPHHLQVVAVDRQGNTASDELRSVAIAVQEAMEVARRPLFVRVERDGRAVRDLGRESFTVFDDGERQELVTFERGDVPFTGVLLLDASLSMRGTRLRTALQGVSAFAAATQRGDESKLLLFADHVLLETPFTHAASFLTLGLPSVTAEGGTALNDALALALARLAPRSGRKVALLLSDGIDVESVLSMRWVLEQVRRSGVILYWLRLPMEGATADPTARVVTPWRDADAQEAEMLLLQQAIAESGGRILQVASVEQVEGALASVLQELREQYVLGYYPSRSRGSGAWHEVRVQVSGAGAQVRAHRGYVEP
jgi:Ca-activated chloride channel family protein